MFPRVGKDALEKRNPFPSSPRREWNYDSLSYRPDPFDGIEVPPVMRFSIAGLEC
jgi:hypothetical protein